MNLLLRRALLALTLAFGLLSLGALAPAGPSARTLLSAAAAAADDGDDYRGGHGDDDRDDDRGDDDGNDDRGDDKGGERDGRDDSGDDAGDDKGGETDRDDRDEPGDDRDLRDDDGAAVPGASASPSTPAAGPTERRGADDDGSDDDRVPVGGVDTGAGGTAFDFTSADVLAPLGLSLVLAAGIGFVFLRRYTRAS
ncbi:hypothetical protein GCM10022221_52730 [Actinocorallia aurea]